MRLSVSLALLVLALNACTSITPRGLISALQLDPLRTDPTHIGAAIGLPDTMQLRDGDAYLAMAYTVDGEADPRIHERFPLRLMDDSAVVHPPIPAMGEVIFVTALSPQAAARLRRTQAAILALRESGIEGTGTLAIRVTGGCSTARPPTSLPVRTFLRTGPDGEFVQLTHRRDLLDELAPAARAALLAGIGDCKHRQAP